VITPVELQAAQQVVRQVHAADPLLDYVQAIIAATRSGQWFIEGLSPRAGIALLRAARACALLAQRDYLVVDDVQAVAEQTLAHRLVPLPGAGRGSAEQVRAMIAALGLV
jgi:MoxR-like ATPase